MIVICSNYLNTKKERKTRREMKGKEYETIRRCKTKHLNLYNAFLKANIPRLNLRKVRTSLRDSCFKLYDFLYHS